MAALSPEVAALLLRIGDLAGQSARPAALADELTRVARAVRQLFDAGACSIALVDADAGWIRFEASDGAGSDTIVGVTLPISRGIAGWVVMSGEAIAVADVEADPRFARDVASATDYVPRALLAAPLVDPRRGVVGVIELLDPDLESMDTGLALNILGTVGDQAAAIVRLAVVFDALGAALLRSAAESADDESFGVALQELARNEDDDDGLAQLASTLASIAALGPEAAGLGQRILSEVAAFARTRR